MEALQSNAAREFEHEFADAFSKRAGKKPERTTILGGRDMLLIRADGTLTRQQGVLSTRDPALASEISRSVLDDLAHTELWEAVEGFTGSTVVAVLSDQSVDPDVAVLCFLLGRSEPVPAPQG